MTKCACETSKSFVPRSNPDLVRFRYLSKFSVDYSAHVKGFREVGCSLVSQCD